MNLEVMQEAGSVICRLPGKHKSWGLFQSPEKIIQTRNISQVNFLLEQIESETVSGKYAAGFISYEAAPAFDPAYEVHECNNFPLIWFGIYPNAPEHVDFDYRESTKLPVPKTLIDYLEYQKQLDIIKEHIAAGDIYQANFTIRTICNADKILPHELFLYLCSSHPVPYAAYVNTGKQQIVSISPELYICRNKTELKSSPMKGTARRTPLPAEDAIAIDFLKNDPKNCAENLMILDMVRNDFGRVCIPGSIKVDPIFHVDTYRTVHQMISTVHGSLPANTFLKDILKATFPASSITGAPKIRAMEIINKTEDSPRKVYTGSIGCVFPNKNHCFNVAIRTLIFQNKKIELSVGSGIVFDSETNSEWDETLLKSTFSTSRINDFNILETILHTKHEGFIFLDEHLKRAKKSQVYFGRKWDIVEVRNALSMLNLTNDFSRIRMTIDDKGVPDISITPLINRGWGDNTVKIKLSSNQTSSKDIFLYHKTTNRELYNVEFAKALEQGFNEVIFLNERNEVTEGAISNLFIQKSGKWYTPPLTCGVLPGIWRENLILKLKAEEKVIYKQDLTASEQIMICNSVRGSVEAVLH